MSGPSISKRDGLALGHWLWFTFDMRIELRHQDEGPGFLFLMAKIFFVFIAAALTVYFFLYQKNPVYAAITVSVSLVLFYVLNEAWPQPLPVILMTDDGILDRRLGFTIFWQDVIDAQLEVHGPFLCLRVKNPDSYISQLPPARRETLQFHQSLGFKMLNLEMRGIAVDQINLLDMVRAKIKETQKNL